MIDLETNEVIRTFYSLSEAGNFLNKCKGGAAHISQACSGKRKTAYGYKWEWKTSQIIKIFFSIDQKIYYNGFNNLVVKTQISFANR